MGDRITVTGMVISSMNLSDSDKRVTLLTKEKGKISAFAKGARRPTSTRMGCSQQFAFGEYQIYESGNGTYNIDSAEVKTNFAGLFNDLNAIYYGMYLCEFTGHLTRENVTCKDEINLLYMALRALEKGAVDKKLVRIIFELRFLTEYGTMPEVYRCLKCGREMIDEEHALFNAREGGLICMNCSGGMGGVPISRSSVYSLQFIVSTPVEKLFSFNVAENVKIELEAVRQTYSGVYAGVKCKTEEMLDTV